MHSPPSCSPDNPDEILLAGMMKALGHPVRLGMVRKLLEKSCCCCGELCDCFAHSQSTVSQHLSVLKEAGLLRSQREGNRMLYYLEPKALELLANAVAELCKPGRQAVAR